MGVGYYWIEELNGCRVLRVSYRRGDKATRSFGPGDDFDVIDPNAELNVSHR